jgi:hypothetical protein
MEQEFRKVLRKNRKVQRMSSAVELMDGARWRVAELVKHQENATGSRMLGYQDVGSMIGRSPSWVEKLIGRRLDTKRPDAVALMNIYAVYSRICERIEDAAEKREQHAAGESNHPIDQGVAEKPEDLTIPEFLRRK